MSYNQRKAVRVQTNRRLLTEMARRESFTSADMFGLGATQNQVYRALQDWAAQGLCRVASARRRAPRQWRWIED